MEFLLDPTIILILVLVFVILFYSYRINRLKTEIKITRQHVRGFVERIHNEIYNAEGALKETTPSQETFDKISRIGIDAYSSFKYVGRRFGQNSKWLQTLDEKPQKKFFFF